MTSKRVKNAKGIEHSHKCSSLTIKLWNIEILTLEGTNEEQQQQLTLQPALMILHKGKASLRRGVQETRMSRDTVYFCPAHTTFGIKGNDENPVMAVVFYFGIYKESEQGHRSQLEEVSADELLWDEDHFTLSSPDRLNLTCRVIYDHFQSDDDFKKWRAQAEFHELLIEILSVSSSKSKGEKKQGLEQAKEYMDTHYNEELSIDQLARIAEVSPKYFGDIFKKTYGQSVMEYLAQVRMSRAKQLMLGSSRILKDVAHMVGYKDEFYFSRKFKKTFGVSPSAYIKKKKNRIAIYGSTSLLGFLMPLNVIPYAAPLHPKWSRYYYHTLGPDIPIHLDAYRVNHNKIANLEKLQSSEPELIISAQGLENWEKERLQQIAPLYELPPDSEGWQKQLRWLAHLLNRNQEAEQWIESFHARRLAFCRTNAETANGRTLLAVRLYHHQLELHRSPGMSEVLFDYLQFSSPKMLEHPGDDVSLSVEKIQQIDTDNIVLLVRQDSETLEYWRRLQSTPDWMLIPAVREGKLHLLSSYPWREYSPIALEYMMEESCRIFSGNRP